MRVGVACVCTTQEKALRRWRRANKNISSAVAVAVREDTDKEGDDTVVHRTHLVFFFLADV